MSHGRRAARREDSPRSTAALVAAVVVPGGAPGVGIVAVALLVALAAWLGTGSSLDLWLFGAAALALAGIAALSDAGWVVAIDLVAAILLGTLAVGGATLLAPIAPARALRSVPEITPRPNAAVVPVARGIGLVGIVTVPFAALLISADAAFAAIADGIPFPATDLWPARGVVFVVVLAGALGLGLVRREQFRQLSLERSRALRPIEWMLPLGALVALFVAFVGVQVTVLFGGRDHVLRTTGLTYAEYARSGYWQLLATAVLTLAVIAAALRLADTPRRSHRLILRALLAALCGLTLVLLASALHRLDLYESAFGLTRLRLTAEAFAWGLAGFFALIVAGRRGADRPSQLRADGDRSGRRRPARVLPLEPGRHDRASQHRALARHGQPRRRLPADAQCRRGSRDRGAAARACATSPSPRSQTGSRRATAGAR